MFQFSLITFSLSFSESDDANDDDSTCSIEVVGLGTLVQNMWLRREPLLCHDLAILAWALSILPEIWRDVNERLDAEKKAAMERGVEKLHLPPSPNKRVAGKPMETILEIFWKEFKHYQKVTGPYGHRPGCFYTPDAQVGRSHLWHESYSLSETEVLGYVACRVTSQRLGIGPGERSWSDVKHIKDGRRSNIGGESIEKRAILVTSARLTEAAICRKYGDYDDRVHFGDDELE